MTMARWVAERLATAWLSLVATALVTGGIALAGMGATLRRVAVDITGIADITSGLMVMGAVLAIAGAISGIANWWTSRASGEAADISSGYLIALIAVAAMGPIVIFLQLSPLVDYWRDLIRLADQYDLLATANGPSALVFVPAAGVLLVPGLQAVAAMTVAMLFATTLLLLLTRSASVLKLTAIGVVLVGGLCAGSWVGVVVTDRLAPAVDTLVRTTADPNSGEQARVLDLVERHRMVCTRSAQTLFWGWIAVLFVAIGTRAAVRARTVPADVVHATQVL